MTHMQFRIESVSRVIRSAPFVACLLLLAACGPSEDVNNGTAGGGGGLGGAGGGSGGGSGGGGGGTPLSAFAVTGTDPPADAVGVQLDSPVVATFSSSVNPGTANVSSFRVTDNTGAPVSGSVSTVGDTVRFTPTPGALVKSTSYQSTLTTAIKNSSGAALPADFTWSFTTTTNAWTPTAASTASPRLGHTAVWTGSEMVVWGGLDSLGTANSGAQLDPGSSAPDPWVATTTVAAPLPRTDHTAVWTGTTMIVWGGNTGLGLTNTGGRYTPSSTGGSWTATANTSGLFGRALHTAIWTGAPNNEMIIWGGLTDSGVARDGARYQPATNSWTSVTLSGAPLARFGHSAVWTGSEMIVWGGDPGGGLGFTNTGGRYRRATGDWSAVSTIGAPTARTDHTAIWTGTEMIVWGGTSDGVLTLNDGARYDPATDTWSPMQDAPISRSGHEAVWTGTEMIVWGGDVSDNSGAAYNPTHDTWRSISIVSAPSGRSGHTAVWTGSEMIVWGGNDSINATNSGGRYAP